MDPQQQEPEDMFDHESEAVPAQESAQDAAAPVHKAPSRLIPVTLSIILTSIIIGGGIFFWQSTVRSAAEQAAQSEQATLKGQITSLQSTIEGLETELADKPDNQTCSETKSCLTGFSCEEGSCKAALECESDPQCGSGNVCFSNKCVPNSVNWSLFTDPQNRFTLRTPPGPTMNVKSAEDGSSFFPSDGDTNLMRIFVVQRTIQEELEPRQLAIVEQEDITINGLVGKKLVMSDLLEGVNQPLYLLQDGSNLYIFAYQENNPYASFDAVVESFQPVR